MICKKQINQTQNQWAQGIIAIGKLKNERNACEQKAKEFIDSLYAFDHVPVLFKPTRCETKQFRFDKNEALSYFIAGKNRTCQEDQGFTSQPWIKIRFENTGWILEENRAITMGNYYFTDIHNQEVKVEYTLGYKLIENQLKIDLHHSSFPFKA
ncbi:hypothetical protein [Ochrovirga pacifica]|uniref:hypothetical protein n=1 Tax=Ochrovirga pacifica TaxID=1042376 RepID=UPI000255A2AD|nr:hypothetical protein [Ochrovirga pacifica]